MKSVRIIYHLTRADFLERVRQYSFLVMLGLVVFLGYQTAIGNLALELGLYRGEFNSAWVGAMMSLIATSSSAGLAFISSKALSRATEKLALGKSWQPHR